MYPNDILSTRAIIKPGYYSLIPPEGLVNNVIPGIEGCTVSILCSKKIGAGFVEYIVTAQAKAGRTTRPFAQDPMVESFLYVVSGDGELLVNVGGQKEVLKKSGYCYAPAGVGISFENSSNSDMKFVLYKQRYKPLEGYETHAVFGHTDTMTPRISNGMEDVLIYDLLPMNDLAFDLNFHILCFKPGSSHLFVETHVQEHGAYVLSGEGAYRLGESWTMVKKDDFIWFGPFSEQGAYCAGRKDFSYVYSKDCNRDEEV